MVRLTDRHPDSGYLKILYEPPTTPATITTTLEQQKKEKLIKI